MPSRLIWVVELQYDIYFASLGIMSQYDGSPGDRYREKTISTLVYTTKFRFRCETPLCNTLRCFLDELQDGPWMAYPYEDC